MSNLISQKIEKVVSDLYKNVEECESEIEKYFHGPTQVENVCTSILNYIEGVNSALSEIDNEDAGQLIDVLSKALNQIYTFSKEQPSNLSSSILIAKNKKKAYQVSLSSIEVLVSEVKDIEEERNLIMKELEAGNILSNEKKSKRSKRSIGTRPEKLKTSRNKNIIIDDSDGEIDLEDI